MRVCHGCKQVRSESRNAALARQIVSHKGDLANFGTFFQEAVPSVVTPRAAMYTSLAAKREWAAGEVIVTHIVIRGLII